MKGHTGATMSLGKGGIYSGLWEQCLVARSSTESELIGVYDTLPQVLWTKQLLEEQGWRVTEFRQPIQVQSHLEMPGILVQLGCIQCT